MTYIVIGLWALIAGIWLGERTVEKRVRKQVAASDAIAEMASRVLVAHSILGPAAYMTETSAWSLGGREFEIIVQPK